MLVRRIGVCLVIAISVIALVNLGIFVAHLVASRSAGRSLAVDGVPKFTVVDADLWRGAAPTSEGYRALAARGVRTVVDLRAEPDIEVPQHLLTELGLTRVALPIRDGQTPSATDVAKVLDLVARDGTPVFVHCGAGVGRTGAMVAAYRAARGDSEWSIWRDNLAVGPPSLEQLAYVVSVQRQDSPPLPVQLLSRLFDAPRRIATRF